MELSRRCDRAQKAMRVRPLAGDTTSACAIEADELRLGWWLKQAGQVMSVASAVAGMEVCTYRRLCPRGNDAVPSHPILGQPRDCCTAAGRSIGVESGAGRPLMGARSVGASSPPRTRDGASTPPPPPGPVWLLDCRYLPGRQGTYLKHATTLSIHNWHLCQSLAL